MSNLSQDAQLHTLMDKEALTFEDVVYAFNYRSLEKPSRLNFKCFDCELTVAILTF